MEDLTESFISAVLAVLLFAALCAALPPEPPALQEAPCR